MSDVFQDDCNENNKKKMKVGREKIDSIAGDSQSIVLQSIAISFVSIEPFIGSSQGGLQTLQERGKFFIRMLKRRSGSGAAQSIRLSIFCADVVQGRGRTAC